MIRHIDEPKGSATTPAQAFLDEGGGDAENRFGAEPRGEHGGGDDRQRQMAAGDGEILGAMDAGRGKEADADGNHEVENDEPDQHDRTVNRKKGLKTQKLYGRCAVSQRQNGSVGMKLDGCCGQRVKKAQIHGVQQQPFGLARSLRRHRDRRRESGWPSEAI